MQSPKIGAYVLETLTTGMYINPLDTLREFVQNSADSIRKAEQEGIIQKGEGRIVIYLDPQKRRISIRDNGLGVPQTEIESRLINIGMSSKRIETDAGFRGIGRLAGIAYCKNLVFHTSTINEVASSIIELNCEGIKKSISPAMRQVEELPEVMGKNSYIKSGKCKNEEHFFEVAMEDIEINPNFLEWKNVEEYLCHVAPVGFDAHRFIYAPEINKWIKKHNLSFPTVNLILKTPEMERQVFKPYKSKYKTKRDNYEIDIKDIGFYPEEPAPDALFWIWYSKSDLLGMIDDDRAAGLRFRKNNIELGGPERVAELFASIAESNSRFNAYYIGEIHMISPEAIPNARRDGFEEVGIWPTIKSELTPFIRSRCEEVRTLSENRNRPTAKVLTTAKVAIDEAKEGLKNGFVSEEERNSILKNVVKEKERVSQAQNSRRNPKDIAEIEYVATELDSIHETLENEKPKPNFRPDLDRKQRQIIMEILQILYDTLDSNEYKKAKAVISDKYKINADESDRK
jgi:hypothetical protein